MTMVVIVFLAFFTLIGVAVGTWVDPDTPIDSLKTQALTQNDKRNYELVFSDEFEQEGRTFGDGNDPRWTAIDKNDYTNLALHYYSNENAVTTNGVLNITTERKDNAYKAFDEKKKKFFLDKKHVQSAMLQGWNKFCFTGGIVEFSAKLPGDPDVGGLWPALWMLGNLARATYVGSSDFMWPYSYNTCNPEKRMSQEINACSKVNHYGMAPGIGRGAPEIDVIEAMQGTKEKLPSTNIRRPYQSCSLQVAPGLEHNRPALGLKPRKGYWYEGMEYNHDNGTKSELNPFFYGNTLEHKPKSYTYQADALSANVGLNATHYLDQHIYRVEWEPPTDDGVGGYIRWYTDDIFVYGVAGSNLDISGTEIPREAMYMLINTAVAGSWGFPAPCPEGCDCECYECGNPDCECALPEGYCDNFPASFEIDFVRVYQATNEPKHTLGCSPVKLPTERFIKGHINRYMEDGDKAPIQPVQAGGALCETDSDCGPNGMCSPKGYCVCHDGFTGPTCLAYTGTYINESRSNDPQGVGWSKLYMPTSLFAVILVIILGFIGLMIGTARERARSRQVLRYQRVSAPSPRGGHVHHPPNSEFYQNSSDDYALPGKQNVVTYCVIDGRLVDKSTLVGK